MLKDRGPAEDAGLPLDKNALPTPADRIAELETEIVQLREALANRQRYGVVTGALAVRFGISPDRAWQLLVRLSQNSNVKVQVITQVVHDTFFGEVAGPDRVLAATLEAQLSAHLGPVHPESAEQPPGDPRAISR